MHKKITVFLIAFQFIFLPKGFSDEVSDLKHEIHKLQEQLNDQMALIKEQNKQINMLNTRVEELESGELADEQEAESKPNPKDEKGICINWRDGIVCYSGDEKFQAKVGGRMHIDSAWFSEGSDLRTYVGKIKDAGEFRRARIHVKGVMYDDFFYKLQLDFAGGDADFKDAYIGLKNVPYIGKITFGNVYEPFGLEQQISTNYTTFLEFALTDAFEPGRNVGLRIDSSAFDDRLTWSTGVFRSADGFADISDGDDYNWSSRVTFLPLYEDEGRKLVHIGASYSLQCPRETIQYASRPEAHLAPDFVDTGNFNPNCANVFGGEGAIVYGPLSLQAEYVGSLVDRSGDDLYFQGAYAYISYFITGESRPFNKRSAVFTRVKPNNNFSIKNRTFGAWEIACRFSHIDLKHDDISGGIMSDITAGINWYLNPNLRIMGNYIHSHVNGRGDADIFLSRVQIDF